MSETMKDFENELEASYQEMEEKQNMFASMSDEEQAVWEELKQMKEDKTEVEVKVKEIVKGGAVAYLNEVRGFIPASKLSLSYVEDLNEFQGKHLKVRVFDIEVENKRRHGGQRRGGQHPALRRFCQIGKRPLRTGAHLPDQQQKAEDGPGSAEPGG